MLVLTIFDKNLDKSFFVKRACYKSKVKTVNLLTRNWHYTKNSYVKAKNTIYYYFNYMIHHLFPMY